MGSFAKPFHKQLNRPKPKKNSEEWHLQKDNEAVTRLIVRGIITYSEIDKVRMRIIRKLEKATKG